MSIRHALLALLSEGPKYGLQLRQEFEARTGEVGRSTSGRCTRRCNGSSATAWSSRTSPPRKAPRRASTSPNMGPRSWRSGCTPRPTSPRPRVDELVIKVLVALGLPGVDVHEVVQVHRRYLVELMQQWTRLKEDESRFDLSFAVVVDAELFRLDSLVRWLDMADGRLKRAAADDTAPATQPFSLPKARRKVAAPQ